MTFTGTPRPRMIRIIDTLITQRAREPEREREQGRKRQRQGGRERERCYAEEQIRHVMRRSKEKGANVKKRIVHFASLFATRNEARMN
jgi:hypothetical protein